jgi:TetR/AcrR family fatty acid metabolism transcriptional regulator
VNGVATRERILRAALAAFASRGYHRVSVDDIVRASGTSKGAVYHHFPNKEALFLALVDGLADRLAGAVSEAIDGATGALAKVEGAIRAGLETFAANRDLARILLLEAAGAGAAYQAKRVGVHGRFAALIRGYLDQAVGDEDIPPIDTAVATRAWLGALNEVVIAWLDGAEPARLQEAVPTLTSMLLRSIGAGGRVEAGR